MTSDRSQLSPRWKVEFYAAGTGTTVRALEARQPGSKAGQPVEQRNTALSGYSAVGFWSGRVQPISPWTETWDA